MPDAFCTIIWENKSQVKSCVIIWSFFRDPSKLPNYVLLRQGQPCQSKPQRLPLPSKTVHSRFNGFQKFALQQSDSVAQSNKVCFSPHPIISVPEISTFLVGTKKRHIMIPRKFDLVKRYYAGWRILLGRKRWVFLHLWNIACSIAWCQQLLMYCRMTPQGSLANALTFVIRKKYGVVS